MEQKCTSSPSQTPPPVYQDVVTRGSLDPYEQVSSNGSLLTNVQIDVFTWLLVYCAVDLVSGGLWAVFSTAPKLILIICLLWNAALNGFFVYGIIKRNLMILRISRVIAAISFVVTLIDSTVKITLVFDHFVLGGQLYEELFKAFTNKQSLGYRNKSFVVSIFALSSITQTFFALLGLYLIHEVIKIIKAEESRCISRV